MPPPDGAIARILPSVSASHNIIYSRTLWCSWCDLWVSFFFDTRVETKNVELLARCRVRDMSASTRAERKECRPILRNAATIRECNIGTDSRACEGGLAGVLRFAASIDEEIHTTDTSTTYDLDNAVI